MPFHKVLVLAAHPDDEMGCAGTIAKLVSEGASVHLLTFSECSDLNGPELMDEYRAATSLLGVSFESLNLPNRHLPEHRQTILDHMLPGFDLVLTPATCDEHQDHATVTAEAIRAYKHTTILGYELPLNTVRESRMAAYVKVALEVKLDHAELYASQAHKPYMDFRYIEGLARMRGLQAGYEFAEAFEVVRWIM